MAKRKPPVSRISKRKGVFKIGPKASAAAARRPPRDIDKKGKKLK